MHYQEADAKRTWTNYVFMWIFDRRPRDHVDPWEVAEAEETIEKLRTLPLTRCNDYHGR